MSNKKAPPPKPPANKMSSGKKPEAQSATLNGAGAEDESTDSDADSTTGGKDSGKRGGTQDPKSHAKKGK